MIDVKTADRELQTYIRPQTFPVAIRMLKPGEAIPDRAKRPARDFKKLSMNCQVIDMARRYGWMIALTREDHICSLGIAALGFEKPTHLHNSGTLCEGMYTETKEAGQRSETAIDRFKEGEYGALLVAPLDRATFEPDLVCVYANPAQVMRLTQAALWKRGGKLASAFGGRVVCADIIVTTMRTDRPQVILPCSGDRIFGQTQDHEMAFTIPWAQMEEIVEGLRGTHAGGIRYPITQFMEYEAKMPPRYMEANRVWDTEQGNATYTNRDRVVAAYQRSFGARVPGYPRGGALPGFLEQCEALVKAKPPAAIGAVAVGPWTIAMLIRNPETMLLDTFEDPQFIHDLMRITTDFSKIWGDAIVKTGIGLSFSEPTASISLVSPDNYREFIAPYHTELVEYFKAQKVGVTTHICGTTYPIFEDLLQVGFSTISFDLDQQGDPKLYVDQLERFVQVPNGRAVAIGNVDATRFEKTSKEVMYADVKRCIDTAARHSAFILSTSCEIPPKSDPETVKWFMDAAP